MPTTWSFRDINKHENTAIHKPMFVCWIVDSKWYLEFSLRNKDFFWHGVSLSFRHQQFALIWVMLTSCMKSWLIYSNVWKVYYYIAFSDKANTWRGRSWGTLVDKNLFDITWIVVRNNTGISSVIAPNTNLLGSVHW